QPTAQERAVPRAAPRTNPSARPWLDIAGDRYPLVGSLTTLGRDNSADIVVDDPGVSRRHSEVRVTTDGPHLVSSIRDLNSTNGTFVNGDRITSQRLHDGDRVTIGRTSAIFRAGRR
ncbi:MAG: FHA domain-containing protein, partial [Humibacillus sp.]|nr:FHA domain-containing protein [Humibacillus sp.]